MFYVYVLKLANSKLYFGYTNNLKRRFQQHCRGESKYTRSKRPLSLVYYEAFFSEKDARLREKRLKQFKKGYAQLKNRIKDSILECAIDKL
jgi:putative endonuclease